MYIFISAHHYSDFKLYRIQWRGSLSQRAYEQWVLNDGSDGKDRVCWEQLPNQGHGGHQNIGGRLPNQEQGAT